VPVETLEEEELAALVTAWLRRHFPVAPDEQDVVRRLMN
jgi:hypothetical protein